MNDNNTTEVNGPVLGWSDIGRYFIFHSFVSIIFTALFSLILYLGLRHLEPAHWLLAIAWMPISLALYLALRPHGRVAWRLLGFRQSQYYWYLTSVFGWIGLVVLICHGLPELGKAIGASEVLSGRFPDGVSLGSRETRWWTVSAVLLKFAITLPMEIVFRGLILNALLNVWSFKRAIWLCAFISTGSVSYFTLGMGFVPACAIVFFGGLFNGWLVTRSGSILPGLLSFTAFVFYYTIFLERMPS